MNIFINLMASLVIFSEQLTLFVCLYLFIYYENSTHNILKTNSGN